MSVAGMDHSATPQQGADMIAGNFNGDRTATSQGIGIGQTHHVDSEESTINHDEKTRTHTSDSSSLGRVQTNEEKEEAIRDEEVHKLARRYTEQSHQSVYNENPFEAGEDSKLNPASPNFNARAFAKSLLNLQARDPEKWKSRTAGFAFKDLNVYGFGSETDYQKSVVRSLCSAKG